MTGKQEKEKVVISIATYTEKISWDPNGQARLGHVAIWASDWPKPTKFVERYILNARAVFLPSPSLPMAKVNPGGWNSQRSKIKKSSFRKRLPELLNFNRRANNQTLQAQKTATPFLQFNLI